MRKIFKRFSRREKDRGDAVLVTVLISIPLLCICFAFATGVSMATWQQTSYISAAQAAATASLQTTQGSGYLGVNTMQKFVAEYLSQTGRNTNLTLPDGTTAAGQGSAAGETGVFQSELCSTAVINGVTRKLPYIELSLDLRRTAGETGLITNPYTSAGGAGLVSPGAAGAVVNGNQYRVINAQIWEASRNVTWFGVTAQEFKDMTCQPYAVNVSAILFGNNEDLNN